MGLSFEKVQERAPELVSLAKKASFSLSKAGLDEVVAEVELVMDHSYSMADLYQSGQLQELAEQLLALATQLDDDGVVPLFLFDSTCEYAGDIDLGTYFGAVDRLRAGRDWGGTNYAPAIREIVARSKGTKSSGFKRLFGAKEPAKTPRFVLFLTDGYPMDPADTERALREASDYPIFFKFISLGPKIAFLQGLDDLVGRKFDNADYQPLNTLSGLSATQLFDLLLVEWADALKSMRELNLIAS